MIVVLHLDGGPEDPTPEEMRETVIFFAGLRGAMERGIGLRLSRVDVAKRATVEGGEMVGDPIIVATDGAEA